MKTIRDFSVENKRVLVRCDFNVPLDERGNIFDDLRIRATIPTIEYLLQKNAKIILMSHMGDPEGKVVEHWRLNSVQEKLVEYLDVSVTKAKDSVGKEVKEWARAMKPGEILLLENLRFHKEEEENDPEFAKELASLGDVFCNDAFGACHRVHASIVGIPKYLPSAAGFLLEKEIQSLGKLKSNPDRPFVVIVGGAKVESKLAFINSISEVSDFILLGNFLANEAKELKIQFAHPEEIIFPPDGFPGDGREFDLGPQAINLFKEKIAQARTICWAGPLGKTYEKEYTKGSEEIAKAIISSKAFSVIGGGDLHAFLVRYGLRDSFSHLSTGGGAMLAFLTGEQLPGIVALESSHGD